jgi:hypothetical protein
MGGGKGAAPAAPVQQAQQYTVVPGAFDITTGAPAVDPYAKTQTLKTDSGLPPQTLKFMEIMGDSDPGPSDEVLELDKKKRRFILKHGLDHNQDNNGGITDEQQKAWDKQRQSLLGGKANK